MSSNVQEITKNALSKVQIITGILYIVISQVEQEYKCSKPIIN